MKKEINMTIGNPVKPLLTFMIPMIINQFLQQLYNMVDSIVVGRYIGEDALAAVGASSQLTVVFIALATGGGIGCSVVIAKQFGSDNKAGLRISVRTATLMIACSGVILAIIGCTCSGYLMKWLGTPDNIYDDAVSYLFWYFLGLPFLFLYNVINAEFNAMGNSKTPLVLLAICACLNIALDFYFTISLGMGTKGVAIATAFSQFVSACCALFFLVKRIRLICGDEAVSGWFDKKTAGEMIRIAVPSILQQSIIYVGMLFIQTSLNIFGSSVIAGYVAALKIDNFSVLPQQAIGNAMSSYTGQNIGAGKKERIGQGLKWGVIVSLICSLITFIVIWFFAEPLLMIFLKESSQLAIDTGVAYLRFYGLVCFLMVKFAGDGVLRSVGELKGLVLGNLLNFGSRVILARLLCPIYGPSVVHYVIPVGMGLNCLISYLYYFKGSWRKKYDLKK